MQSPAGGRRPILAAALALAAGVAIGWIAAPRGAAAAPSELVPSRLEPSEGFWWADAREQSTVAAWLGPVFRDPLGRPVRTWILSCTLPGSPEPLTCQQGYVQVDADHAIGLQGDLFRVELRPEEPLSWGEVTDSDQIYKEVDGLY